MSGLEGKVAIVTGGSRGVGKGCALELGAAGATVYVTSRTVEVGSAPPPGTIGSESAGPFNLPESPALIHGAHLGDVGSLP